MALVWRPPATAVVWAGAVQSFHGIGHGAHRSVAAHLGRGHGPRRAREGGYSARDRRSALLRGSTYVMVIVVVGPRLARAPGGSPPWETVHVATLGVGAIGRGRWAITVGTSAAVRAECCRMISRPRPSRDSGATAWMTNRPVLGGATE